MRHIKNFFHNLSDFALALIIVAIAAGIIFWRMQIILDYPETAIRQQAVTEESADDAAAAEEAAGAEEGSAAEEAAGAEQEEKTENPEEGDKAADNQ